MPPEYLPAQSSCRSPKSGPANNQSNKSKDVFDQVDSEADLKSMDMSESVPPQGNSKPEPVTQARIPSLFQAAMMQ